MTPAPPSELERPELFRIIAEYTYDWETWVDAHGAASWINPAIERITGYSVAECLAREDYPLGLVCDEDRARVSAVLADAARGGSGNDAEFRVQRKDGTLCWVAISWQAVRSQAGDFLGYRTSVRDIEARKRMEAELHVMRRRAEASAIARTELLANVSHELRSPVHGILGFAELLRDTTLTPEQRRYVERIASECANMQRHVEDLLQFAAIEAGGAQLDRRPFDLEELARSVIEAARGPATQRGLALELELALAQRSVVGDPLRLGQILRNLVDNALKFTERGAVRVRLCSTFEGSDVAIQMAVKDTGIGLELAELQRLVEPFQQGASGTARRHGGVGLGLSIVKRLVAAMHGTLRAESEPGHGTTMHVHVHLPIAAVESDPPPSTAASEAHVRDGMGPTALPRATERSRDLAATRERSELRGGPGPDVAALQRAGRSRDLPENKRALVVDDQASARELLRALLERAGYEVDEAASGREALACAAKRPCDLVLLDYQMPDWDGAETAVALRRAHAAEKSTRKLAIYLLTANVFAREQLEHARTAIDGILEKPLSRATLVRLLDSLTDTSAPPAQPAHEPLPRYLDARVIDDLCNLTTPQGEPLFLRVFQRTREDVARSLAAAREALSTRAFAELGRRVHELAGQAAIVGARDVTRRARALEDALSTGEAAEPAITRGLQGLARAWQRAERALLSLGQASSVRT